MHSIFIIGLVIITSFFYSKSIAFAGPDSGQQSMVADNQNPMQKGKGLLVTGILTTTILCSAGALSAMI